MLNSPYKANELVKRANSTLVDLQSKASVGITNINRLTASFINYFLNQSATNPTKTFSTKSSEVQQQKQEQIKSENNTPTSNFTPQHKPY